MTRVINITHGKPYDVYIGRAGKGQDGYFGNPHSVGYCQLCGELHARGEALEAYKKYFVERVASDKEFVQRLEGLRGLTLGCFCRPRDGFRGEMACHGQVIVQWLGENWRNC